MLKVLENNKEDLIIEIHTYAEIAYEEVTATGEEIASKMMRKFFDDISSIWSDIDDKHISAEKVATRILKAIKKNPAKLLEQTHVKDILTKMFANMDIELVSFEAGYKLTDDDYEFIDDGSVYTEETSKGVVARTVSRGVRFKYEEDDELYNAVIPAFILIGKGNL